MDQPAQVHQPAQSDSGAGVRPLPGRERRTLKIESVQREVRVRPRRSGLRWRLASDSEAFQTDSAFFSFGLRSLLRRSPTFLASESEAFCDGVRG